MYIIIKKCLVWYMCWWTLNNLDMLDTFYPTERGFHKRAKLYGEAPTSSIINKPQESTLGGNVIYKYMQ